MIKCYGINFTALPPGEFDAPLGIASGAGDIFGTTGGVMEATLRAASELVTGKPADRLEFTEVRAVEGLRETYVAIGEHNIHVGVANGLTTPRSCWTRSRPARTVPRDRGHGLPRRLLRRRRPALSGRGRYRCSIPSCSARGPAPCTRSTAARSSASRTKTRPSKRFTDQFLGGPGTEKAHELLHTHYQRETAARHPMSL